MKELVYECQCKTCPIGALGYGTIGCLEMKNASPLFGKRY